MSTPHPVHCIVDDTSLTTNIAEIETWVSQGVVTLVIPLYSKLRSAASFLANRLALERLHLLKKDASQIGQNARKSVKFLDRMTSGKLDLPAEPIIIQGPEEQYATWQEVDAHYMEESVQPAQIDQKQEVGAQQETTEEPEKPSKRSSSSGNALSQMLLDKLNFAPQPAATSPGSTPPISPPSSEPQSSKTSPEVKAATLSTPEKSPVPPLSSLCSIQSFGIFMKRSRLMPTSCS